MKHFSPLVILALGSVCLLSMVPEQADALGLKKGLKILAPLAIIGGAAGAGGLAGALLASKHRQPVHHYKHIHYHPVHTFKHVHFEPIHTVKVVEKHGWDDGWHADEGWTGDLGHGWW